MGRKRKFRQGPVLSSVSNAIAHIRDGGWLFYRDKPMSPKWLIHWSIAQIQIAVRWGHLRYALKVEDENHE